METRGLYDLIKYLQNGTNLHIGVLFFGSHGNVLCRLPHEHSIHAGRVCTAMKASGAGFRRCFRCRNLALKRAMEEKIPFGGICAAGVYEYTHPMLIGDTVGAVIFIGNLYDEVRSEPLLSRRLGAQCSLIETMEHSLKESDCAAIAAIVEGYIRSLLSIGGDGECATVSLIENIKGYIAENLEYGAELPRIAEVFHYNKTYLGRIFKKEVGMSVSEYINRQRIERAKALLSATRASVIDVSQACGFTSVTYFNRLFRAKEGITPSLFRKKHPDKGA